MQCLFLAVFGRSSEGEPAGDWATSPAFKRRSRAVKPGLPRLVVQLIADPGKPDAGWTAKSTTEKSYLPALLQSSQRHTIRVNGNTGNCHKRRESVAFGCAGRPIGYLRTYPGPLGAATREGRDKPGQLTGWYGADLEVHPLA
jgi:hypothetical protein